MRQAILARSTLVLEEFLSWGAQPSIGLSTLTKAMRIDADSKV